MTVRTRFAPSPTGFLHIGGARTALFNYLYAKRHNGEFLLRIEDTDQARSTKEAVDAILTGMDWLGLTPDAPALYQMSRVERHRECVDHMLETGKAFRCYVTQEELARRKDRGNQLREEAKSQEVSEAERKTMLNEADSLLAPFRSPYRNGAPPPSASADFTVRLRAPDSGRIAFKDAVQGQVSVSANSIDDLVLLRADGSPTYMLAVVVDDHDMGISHVIRGDDHLNNTYRQIPIYNALEWELPEFAHVPMILGPDGKKYSKRHGAQGVEAWRDLGYLPEGMRNYLLRLGWAHGDREIISDTEATEIFDLDGLNKAPARMDLDKLGFINSHYLRQADTGRIIDLVLQHLNSTAVISDLQKTRLKEAMPIMKGRGATIIEIADASTFLLAERPIDFPAKSLKKLKDDTPVHLEKLKHKFENISEWNAEQLESLLKDYSETNEIGMGRFAPALRLAMTGGKSAPDLGLVLQWFGKQETIDRVDDLIVYLSERPAG